MKMVIGLDTSCYTTSCAAVSLEGEVLASVRRLLPVQEGERGLRQSEAVFIHVRQLPELMEELSRMTGHHEIAAVCASARPRDPDDSYMPVFTVGEAQGRALAAMLGVPCFLSTHQRGHIAAARIQSGIREGDLLAVHLSGGTTELLSLTGEQLTCLGGTKDLHAGQFVDRVGVAMGLPFPAGPHLEVLAERGTARSVLPVCMTDRDLSCHFSGVETKVQQLLQQDAMRREDLAMEVYDVLARTMARMVLAGFRETGIGQVLLAGGVASSLLFRRLLRGRIDAKIRKGSDFLVCFGRPEYSGDNAVGAAMIGRERYLQRR